MRARMALKLAGVEVEIREISLRDKPTHMLQVSPKATVPVLVLVDGAVIEESIEIMLFALKNHALGANIHAPSRAHDFKKLVSENDGDFKQALDAYKYPERFPNKTQTQHRADGEVFLQKLENQLNQHQYLFGEATSLADIAIFPFVRQFAAVDESWWQTRPYPKLHVWLSGWLSSDLFNSVMTKSPTFID